jgi:kynurenine formamidase
VPKARSQEFWIEPKHTFEMFHGVTKFERLLILTTSKENSDKCHILVYADPYKLLWITQQQLRECSSTSTSHFFLAQGVTFDGLDAYRTNVDLRWLSTLFIACSQMHFRLLTERICRSECMWNQEKKTEESSCLFCFLMLGCKGCSSPCYMALPRILPSGTGPDGTLSAAGSCLIELVDKA